MTYSEKVDVKKLEVYFNNVLPFFKETDDVDYRYLSTTSREVYCSSTIYSECYVETGN